jgi:hypothetical protein
VIGALAAWAISLTPPAPDAAALDARIRQSAAEAQALQGPMDGAWILTDARGRPLYRLQITDPAGGAGVLDAMWSGVGANSPSGLAAVSRRGGVLGLDLETGDGAVAGVVRLERHGRAWSGWLRKTGHRRAVRLYRTP